MSRKWKVFDVFYHEVTKSCFILVEDKLKWCWLVGTIAGHVTDSSAYNSDMSSCVFLYNLKDIHDSIPTNLVDKH